MNDAKYIDIVFDGPPGPESGRFVEAEDEAGNGIGVGTWINRGNGLWAFRIPAPSPYTPVEVAVALSLYAFNVSPSIRAEKLYEHFDGECMEGHDLTHLFIKRGEFAATELPYPTAKVLVQHALKMYGDEARRRCAVEEDGFVQTEPK